MKKSEQAQVKKEEAKKKEAFEKRFSYLPSPTLEQHHQEPHQSSSTPLQRPKIICKKQSTEKPVAIEHPNNDYEIVHGVLITAFASTTSIEELIGAELVRTPCFTADKQFIIRSYIL
ncbi:hypothetical protein L1987_09659 [Smallanthus sonchifolius]|uniref:Uncharacterized protein n=1 Tax=Smallanthus sonchifolius TaxID=185202 RepID=A0ACB9JQ14_9ASTR|nr:hypothetical protein L1987_09659 [Smallanthus sonchifolius]